MAFHFKEHESVREGIRRIAGHEIQTVLSALREGHAPASNGHAASAAGATTSAGGRAKGHGSGQESGQGCGPGATGLDTIIHDTRKSLKRLRTLVRLVREEVGEKAYRRENLRFRDAARPLSAVRDAKVLVDTLDALADHFKGQVKAKAFEPLRRALAERSREARAKLEQAGGVEPVAAAMEKAAKRLEDWAQTPALRHEDWGAIRGGLGRIYRQGREGRERARGQPTFENLHEWRKRVKDLWHALQLLAPAWPAVLEPLAGEAHGLADFLGDDHDLSVLQQAVSEEPRRCGSKEDYAENFETLGGLIDARRSELQASARALGERLYADKPPAFATRLERFWSAWQAENNRLRA